MALLPNWNLSDIKELIKKGLTIEAEEKIMELKELVLRLKEENMNLLEENKTFKAQKDLSDKIIWNPPFYYVKIDNKKKDGPYCQKCYDNDKKLIRVQLRHETRGVFHKCFNCKNEYWS